ERNCSLLLMVREKEIIFQISSTLQRLESGSYGICEECGEDISEARLEALPETRLCVDCKRKEELNCAVTDLAASSRVIH
ncbi:MAG: TraR/DksA C4-type zinc finger protein, partial [Deltaproteobacteria bacterium]|nr:TraR/DksA C4-type zinc finger protein [Deltaproteobacteria bacterium]